MPFRVNGGAPQQFGKGVTGGKTVKVFEGKFEEGFAVQFLVEGGD